MDSPLTEMERTRTAGMFLEKIGYSVLDMLCLRHMLDV